MMFKTDIKIRVRYSETDKMGYTYYGHYAAYFEVARVEALRQLDISYRALEDNGILLPVIAYQVRFIRPAFYDDELTIRTTVPVLPTSKIRFEYETFRNDECLNTAWTELVFVNKASGKPLRCPSEIVKKMTPFFNG